MVFFKKKKKKKKKLFSIQLVKQIVCSAKLNCLFLCLRGKSFFLVRNEKEKFAQEKKTIAPPHVSSGPPLITIISRII